MTLIVGIMASDNSILIAADSRTTTIYHHLKKHVYKDDVDKIFPCPNNCCISSSGSAVIGDSRKSLETEIREFCMAIRKETTLNELVKLTRNHFSNKRYDTDTEFIIFGHDRDSRKARIFRFFLDVNGKLLDFQEESIVISGTVDKNMTVKAVHNFKSKQDRFSVPYCLEFITYIIDFHKELEKSNAIQMIGGPIDIFRIINPAESVWIQKKQKKSNTKF